MAYQVEARIVTTNEAGPASLVAHNAPLLPGGPYPLSERSHRPNQRFHQELVFIVSRPASSPWGWFART